MSYMSVLQALEPGDVITFNDSGGANAEATPELEVAPHTNTAIQHLMCLNTGHAYRVKKVDGDLRVEYDRSNKFDVRSFDWKDYETIETIELIGRRDSE